MEEITLWLALLAAYMKTDPVYSFLLDSVPMMVVSTFGAMAEIMIDQKDTSAKKAIGSFMSAIVVAIVVTAASKESDIRTHYSVAVGLLGGFKGRVFIETCVKKVTDVIRKFEG